MRKAAGKRNNRAEKLFVLHEDEAVIVLDKPAGLPSVPIKGSDLPSAWSSVSEELHRRRQKAYVVHRIDRFTSGIILFAKTEPDRDMLVRQFLKHSPVRRYIAVLRGRLKEQEGTLVHYLRKQGMVQKVSVEGDKAAARAELRYRVQRPLRHASLVGVELVTGLQNQIRVQFAAIGHPVVGDRKYHPDEAAERRIQRVALHASHLEFVHPRSMESISVDSRLPADLKSLVESLTLPARPQRRG